MNSGISDLDPTVRYYDSDYPSPTIGAFPENFDEVVEYQGIAADVPRYLEMVEAMGGLVLELCCGTGRVAIPLARAGHNVTAVDLSAGMLDRFRENLAAEHDAVRSRVELVLQDVTRLSLGERGHRLAIMAFNSLLCIPDARAQCAALDTAAAHLAPGGALVLHLVNPLVLRIDGDPVPKPFFTRRNVHTGNRYTRFAMSGPFDEQQRQRLRGWYDEEEPDGTVRRSHYSILWRPIFRFEIELMLERSGFAVESVDGSPRGEPFAARSPMIFVRAQKCR